MIQKGQFSTAERRKSENGIEMLHIILYTKIFFQHIRDDFFDTNI